ncbi:hypothetical protein HPP92_020912 [Vanilla planifolia]|uniref:DM2 domain-containing protein n=1 Tax=Vanilla planifolia TaxID=51239 RepID=A0A835Q1K0_VANPL|nr:hypothetical protein HPP92_020912 [Vanilla planifolia]
MSVVTSLCSFTFVMSGDFARARCLSGQPSIRKAPVLSIRALSSPKTTVDTEDTEPKKSLRGIMKPRPVSPELQAFVGAKEIPRTEALKQIWAYIKENNLQDPENKRIVVCDEKLKSIFGGS